MDKFDEATREELTSFLEKEQARARVQETVQTLTSTCWDKCITGTPSSHFARGEEACLANCVDRFLDTSLFIVRSIEQLQQRQQ